MFSQRSGAVPRWRNESETGAVENANRVSLHRVGAILGQRSAAKDVFRLRERNVGANLDSDLQPNCYLTFGTL